MGDPHSRYPPPECTQRRPSSQKCMFAHCPSFFRLYFIVSYLVFKQAPLIRKYSCWQSASGWPGSKHTFDPKTKPKLGTSFFRSCGSSQAYRVYISCIILGFFIGFQVARNLWHEGNRICTSEERRQLTHFLSMESVVDWGFFTIGGARERAKSSSFVEYKTCYSSG